MKSTITIFVAGVVLCLASCSKDDAPPKKQPVITSFSPLYTVPGETVTILGENFNTTPSKNTVLINGVQATVTTASATELTVTVPSNATTGKISVAVAGKSALSVTDFEVLKDFPRNGLLGFWPFTGSGEEKGINNPSFTFSTESSSNPSLTSDRYGNTNRAINFNGIQSSAISLSIINQPWTISVWIDPGEFNNPTMGFIESNSGNRYLVFNFANNTTGDFYINAYGDDGTEETHGNYYSLVSSVPANRYIPNSAVTDNWMHISMTFDGTVFKVFKDNAEVYSNTVTTQTPTPTIFMLGKTHNTYYYIGKMDDLILYNRVLTATERTQVYEQTISKY